MKLEAAPSWLQSCRNSLNSGGRDVALGSQYECPLASTKVYFNSALHGAILSFKTLSCCGMPWIQSDDLNVCSLYSHSKIVPCFHKRMTFFCLCSVVFFRRCLLWPKYRIWSQYWIWVLTLTLISSGAFVKLAGLLRASFFSSVDGMILVIVVLGE